MNRQYSPYFKGGPRYVCNDCEISCTSLKQLKQHIYGIKHQTRLHETSREEAEENTFPLEYMVVLDQTEDDSPNDNAALPASCDSSDSEIAASTSDLSRRHLVVLDETNDDSDEPASCDLSASECAPLSPEAEAVHGTSGKSTGKKHRAKSGSTLCKESQKIFHIEPVKSNQDAFQFLKMFAIANESDIAFSVKVKDMLYKALTKYKERKLEEIFCTEAEHSSPEEVMESIDVPSNHEETKPSVIQATNKNECERINLAADSPPTQCIVNFTFTADCQRKSLTINQSYSPDTSSIATRSPTNTFEDINTSEKLPATSSRNDNLLMECENCGVAEAACSDDDDDV